MRTTLESKAEWMSRGFCRTSGRDPDLWFPDTGNIKQINEAKWLCKNACPVQRECGEYAVSFPVQLAGVWGGLSQREIQRHRSRLGMPFVSEAALSELPRDWGER